jgi:hypothetical protein
LDEDALVLDEYGPITAANGTVSQPIAYALRGVDPRQFLVMRVDATVRDDLGPMGPFMVLWRDLHAQPDGICPYADPEDPQYPSEACPLSSGRTYSAEMVVDCGLDVPVGPYGGDYWRVVDPPPKPPTGSPFPGMSLYMDYGTISLVDADTLNYVSERGAKLVLDRVQDPQAAAQACPRPAGY